MRVYASTIWLEAEQGTRQILAIVAGWITASERRNMRKLQAADAARHGRITSGAGGVRAEARVTADDMSTPGIQTLDSGAKVEVAYTDFDSPYLHCMRYTHSDSTERGRSWVTEVGLRAGAGNNELECSIYLYTDEVSTRVPPPAKATRPLLVRELLRRGSPTSRTTGLTLRELTSASANELGTFARNTTRTGPLVIVSARPDTTYAVDLQRLHDQLSGLAQVVQIPPHEDTRALATVFGDGLIPYAGAIAVLFPVRPGPYAAPVPARRLVPGELDAIRDMGKIVEEEVFTLVTERMNVTNVRRHISLDTVNRERARRSSARHARAGASADEVRLWNIELEHEVERLENELARQDREIAASEVDILTLSEEADRLKEELHDHRSANAALQGNLLAARDGRALISTADKARVRQAFSRNVDGSVTPEDCLLLIELLYGDRVVILESALVSARDSVGFRDGAKVLDLLHKLVGKYWEALVAGRPDSEARKAFPPKRFAAKENKLSAEGRERRVFFYRQQAVFMEAHLKAGDTGGSPDTTLRIHFHWDAETKRIVVGHCGPHIPF